VPESRLKQLEYRVKSATWGSEGRCRVIRARNAILDNDLDMAPLVSSFAGNSGRLFALNTVVEDFLSRILFLKIFTW
jgi:hypothetical protein